MFGSKDSKPERAVDLNFKDKGEMTKLVKGARSYFHSKVIYEDFYY